MQAAKCPHCGLRFEYDQANQPGHLPFCCERCQWIDLGKWLTEEYRVSRGLLASDEEQED